ncbi:MAG TPA: LytTR family DNA-binding domain-containing protein [Casimicrobiaceae bacterium]|jgi:DNA-binding LytR/AlgR family response regulator
MSGPTAVLAEDEAHLREELRETLAELWPELVICAEARNGLEAREALERHAPDILFLDIQMPGLTGLEIAKLANGRCHVVFVTAYDQYAVAAFEHGAVDYVMKPVSADRLEETVRRLKARVHDRPANLDHLLQALAERLGDTREYIRWITASQGQELRLITVDEVCYFQADRRYTLVVTADRESLIRRPIKELAEEVDPKMFWQIHRGTLVNANAIAGLVRDLKGHFRVKLKQRSETLSVSESCMHLFREM